MNNYKVLFKQKFCFDDYSIVPIRHEDRFEIMTWRNEQIYHIRQEKLLKKEIQNEYFDKVISKIFNQKKPKQILFSFLKSHKCIGYGGLVYIDYINKNAEISFVMDTLLEKKHFIDYWQIFLKL